MAKQGCINEGPDSRLLGWLICPLQRWFSFKSDPPKWRSIEWEALPEEEWFFDAEETLRRLGLDTKDKKNYQQPVPWRTEDEVRYKKFATWGFARPRWFAVYWVSQKRVARRNYTVLYIGWRFDSNWRGFIFPAIARQSKQMTPLHRGY